MNETAPKTTGLQIAIILAALLATILAVTTYLLYQENLQLKQELEQRKARASTVVPARCMPDRGFDSTLSRNPHRFLLVSHNERYNRFR